MRQASVLIADEVTYSLNGKMNVFGIYTGDIVIPVATAIVSQLIFVFIVETEPTDPIKELQLQAVLPSGQTAHTIIPVNTLINSLSDEIRWNIRVPLVFNSPILTPGAIIAKVIHERGEIVAIAPVIRTASSPTEGVSH